ncbi:MAG: hypothetical protein V3T72_17675 [Thermoanaerobaculia bacterium]
MLFSTGVLLVLTVIVLIVGAVILWLWRKKRREHRAEDEHAARQRRIDHLAELIASGERDAHFDADVTARLHRFVESLREESRL